MHAMNAHVGGVLITPLVFNLAVRIHLLLKCHNFISDLTVTYICSYINSNAILSFHMAVTVLGCYAVWVGTWLWTFYDSLSSHLQGSSCQLTLHNIPEEQRPKLHRSRTLQSHIFFLLFLIVQTWVPHASHSVDYEQSAIHTVVTDNLNHPRSRSYTQMSGDCQNATCKCHSVLLSEKESSQYLQ